MANTLRDLLLSIKVRVDKSAIKETDAAFDHAAKSAAGFENRLQRIGAKMRQHLGMARRPTVTPDLPGIADTRTGTQKALDAFKAKAQSAMASARASVDRFNTAFDSTAKAIFNARTALGGFALVMAGTAVGHFFGEVIEAGGALHDMAQRTRVSVESLQVWKAVAEDAGVDANNIEGAFRKLTKAMAAAARGGKVQSASFKELGVEFKNSDGSLRSVEDVLIDTGAALAQMDDDAKATAIATQLLGPAGMGLVPAFNQGADAVRKLSIELRENVALNAEEAARLDDVGDALARGQKKWKALKDRLVVAFLPVLEAVSGAFEKVSKWFLRMTKDTKILQAALGSFAGLGLARLLTMFTAWIARVGGARAAMALLGQGLRTGAAAAARFVLPLLFIEDFLTFLAGGKSVFGRAFEEIFGAGGAKSAREGILKVFQEIGAVIRDEVLPVIREIAQNPFVTTVGKVALETFLGLLNLIGLAFANDSERIDELGSRFLKNTAAMSDAIDGLINKLKEFLGLSSDEPRITKAPDRLSPQTEALAAQSPWFRDQPDQSKTGFFGEPLRSPEEIRANIANGAPAASVPGAKSGAAGPVTLNDQRKIEVNVTSSENPGAVGRAAAGAVGTQLNKDRRQTLAAVSG